ncbi:MAG: 2TM domain-containing protein [Sediminicola sp.]|mgnify:CR=1 FL=1
MDHNYLDKQQRAKKQIEELKGFYIHLTVYILVNGFISGTKIIRNLQDGETFTRAFFDFGTVAVWLFWGIGLLFHAMKVFSFNPLFGKEWEERQIRKYMDREREESRKF